MDVFKDLDTERNLAGSSEACTFRQKPLRCLLKAKKH